jgi:hypothetical protein
VKRTLESVRQNKKSPDREIDPRSGDFCSVRMLIDRFLPDPGRQKAKLCKPFFSRRNEALLPFLTTASSRPPRPEAVVC